MMTWEEFFNVYGKAGLGYQGIDVAEDGHVVIHTDLIVKTDCGGDQYLAEIDEFADDAEEA